MVKSLSTRKKICVKLCWQLLTVRPKNGFFGMTDEQAMWRVQMLDDPAAFAELVKRWQGPIQQLCARMTGDLHQGEDLAQDAFVRVFAKRKDFQQSSRFSTWLWRIALNLCYDSLRRTARRGEIPLENETDAEPPALRVYEPGPDDQLASKEQAEMVRTALLGLPEHYRAVLVLRHYENLKFHEIADVLGIPVGTVKSRMAEALTQLSRKLKLMPAASVARRPAERMSL
jgi:RNA polymerase sigma-70 factor (ECF subfamily)